MAGSTARRGRRLRLRRQESPELQTNPELDDTDTTASTTRDRSRKRRRGRSRAAEEEKMAWVDEWVRGGDHAKKNKEDSTEEEEEEMMKDDGVAEEEDDDVVSSAPSSPIRAPVKADKYRYRRHRAYEEAFAVVEAKHKEKIGCKEGEKIKADDVAEEEEDDEVVSSAPSSPLRAPIKPDEYTFHYDRAYNKAFAVVEARYNEKRARQKKLPTLDDYKPSNRFAQTPKPLSIRESERRVVLHAAKFVVGVSSSVGGEPLERCSGLWIDWDEDKKTGIVLTTADLVFRYNPSSILNKLYTDDAEVIVHLRDDTAAEAHLLYYQQHYNIALFSVTMDQHVHLPSFNDEVQCGQEIFELGRDERSYLRIGHGRLKNPDPRWYDGYHFMNVLGGLEGFEYSTGGPVIDFDGNVVGIITSQGSVMVSSILLKCLRLWRKFRCIPRPHLGLGLCSIRLLDLAIAEKISVKCNVDEGLIVKEVSKGSHAEKLGIRVGDVIECFNAERMCNTFEFENMLLRTCEDHLERGHGHNSKVDIVIKVFHPRKGLQSNKTLVVDLSEHKERVERVYYPFTIGEGVCASDSSDEVSSD